MYKHCTSVNKIVRHANGILLKVAFYTNDEEKIAPLILHTHI